MNENSDLLPNLLHDEFELQMRGYSRRQVDDFVTRRNNEIRELEQRLARALDESEHMRRELSTLRQQALSGRPAHEEVSERISQILKLADDEAKAQRNKADDDISRLRADAQQEAERVRADARDQAERMLTAAQEQAERAISAARAEADKTRTAARTEADRLTGDTRKKADAALANAKSQAKKVLDEATARASAIHDGAERRLNLLSTRHAETVRRLTDILDGVQGLVAAEAARMSLEEEVAQTVSKAMSMADSADSAEHDGNNGVDQDLDLSLLAPPAPETVATGAAAPPRNGADPRPMPPPPVQQGRPAPPVQPGRPAPPVQPVQPVQPGRPVQAGRPGAPGSDPLDGSPSVPGGMPPGASRGLPVRSAAAQPAPPAAPASQPRHAASSPPEAPRPPMPMPSGPPRTGPVPGTSAPISSLSDAPQTDSRRDPNHGPVDPDDPTDTIRMRP